MTGRISMRPPGVFTFNTSSTEASEKPVAAPGQFPDWLDKLSRQKLELTISERIDRAIIWVLKKFESFRDWEIEKRENLAIDILERLDKEMIYISGGQTSLGGLIWKKFNDTLEPGQSPRFDKHFTNQLMEFVPAIADEMANAEYARLEPKILEFVNSRLKLLKDDYVAVACSEQLTLEIKMDRPEHQQYRDFIRRSIDEVAGIASSRKQTSIALEKILESFAKALHVIDTVAHDQGLTAPERAEILKRIMDDNVPASEPAVLGDEYHKKFALNRAISQQISMHIHPSKFGPVVHPTWEKT